VGGRDIFKLEWECLQITFNSEFLARKELISLEALNGIMQEC
jgi:hypothetical protein